MAVRRNGLYYDPALASAFDNLAEAFKTPSGADVYGYTRANAEREKAARLSDFYNYMKGANYDQATADRLGVGAGAYTPNQSYYAVDQGNDTTLKTNAATNATTLDKARIDNAGALARLYAAPVIVGEGQTAYLPAQTAEATGLPSMFRGNITTRQGENVTTPSGDVITGAPKPLTDAEMKGAILGRLPQSDQRAVAMQGVGTTQVLDSKGEPTIAFTPDAVGRTPYNLDNRQPQLGNYQTTEGKKGTAVFDKDANRWKDTQTGVEIPAGSQILAAPGTQVSIETKAPSKIEDAYGEGIGNQIKTVVENAGAAPRSLAEIAQFREALARASDNITTGPLQSYVLKGKQAIGGLLGTSSGRRAGSRADQQHRVQARDAGIARDQQPADAIRVLASPGDEARPRTLEARHAGDAEHHGAERKG